MLNTTFALRIAALATRSRQGPVLAAAARSFTGNMKKLDEKEKGDEQIFFKRQEGKSLVTMRESLPLVDEGD